MDHQDQKHEGHGIHVCHKCGWSFPNPHPSARHRRAHKRVCGTIEVYKLVGSKENPQSNVSDDEHLSDENHTPPRPKVLEISNNEKGSGGIWERSNRSEDELFSDAVAEFSDSGINSGIEDVEKVTKDDPNISQSFKDVGVADIIQPPSISMNRSQIGNPEISESATNKLGSKPQSEGHVSSSTISSMASSISDYIIEESVVLSHDRKYPPNDSNIFKPETLTDASQENEKTNARDDVIECSLACIGQETDAKGTEESNLDRNFMDSMVTPSRFAGESFEIVSKIEETGEKTLDPVPADRVVQSEEEHDDGSSSKMSQNDLPAEVGSADHVNASIDTSQVEVDAAQGVNHASSGNMFASGNGKEEGNYNVNVFSVPGVSVNHVNASIDTSQIKVDAAEGIHCANSGHIIESCDRKEEENVNVNVLLTEDISIVDPPEIVAEDFKDNRGAKLQEYANLDSCATMTDKEDGAKDSASNENSSSFQSRQLSEGTVVPSSDIHVLEDSGEQEDGGSKVASEVLVEEEVHVSQIKITINEIGSPAEAVTPDIDENHTVQSHEEQETNGIHNNELLVNFPRNATKFLSDAGSNQAINIVGVDDAGNHEKARNERFDVVGDNNGEGAAEETSNKIFSTNSESTGDLSESLVDPTMDLTEGDEASDREKGETEKCDIDGIESREGSKEEDLSMKRKLTSESASSLNESQTVADDIMDGSVKMLPEHECMHLDGVAYSSRVGNNTVSDAGIKDEFNGNDKVEVESLGVSTANESYHGGHVNSLQKTSEDHMTKEAHLSHLETESSVQSSAPVEDNHASEFGGSASGITSHPLEADSAFVKQQIAASAIDVSVDSYSQTDSLEGKWGSVSVLSTQSDAAALIYTEALPSSDSQALAEAEKAHLEEPKAAPEGQHSDKSDMFEAPSFMTLIEPSDRIDQKAAASEVLTVENPPQQSASLQAGWFPSLTHVMNESQGRKKNEEIIAKVTNWGTGKQHTPLKSLLGEAFLESKQRLKKPKENPAPAIQKDETLPKDNGTSATTVNSILGPESPTTQAAKTETKKEWNSPARYPSEIKREKMKAKGRPYWVQFVCCSSIN